MNRSRFPRCAAAFLALLPLALPAQTTGWLQTTYGPWDYNAPANWVGGTANDINGRWDESLTLAAHQLVTLSSDLTATYPLHFGYVGAVDLRLQGAGGDHTLTLGGDINHVTAGGRIISFGNTGADTGLSLDLGGVPRTFTVLGSHVLKPYNALSNGSVTLTGTGTLQMITDNASGVGVDFLVDQSTTLLIDSTASGSVGTTRARDITLRSGLLKVSGNSGADSVDVISGDLIVEPHPKGGISMLTLDANSSRNAKLTAARLVRRDGAILNIMDANIGGTPGPNMANFVLGTAPTLVGGGGAADSTTISILPWGIAGMSSSSNYDDSLLTYDAANGFRPLSYATEFLPSSNVVVGTVTAHNVLVPHTNRWEVAADTTINSLVLGGGDKTGVPATTVFGDGTLTITGGMVLFIYNRNQTSLLSAPLEFGSQQGSFLYASGKPTSLASSISGSGGLVFFQNRTSGTDTGLSVSGDAASSTYTGDTYVLGRVFVPSGFLPSGTRTGNVFVYGNLQINSGTINGLYGSGLFQKPNSGGGTVQIGDNDQDGDFDGSISDFGPLSITKIGAGTQRLAGSCTYDGATTVNGGTLVLDGSFTNSAVTVNTGATLRGAGSVAKATTAITVKSGGTLAPGSTNGIGTLTVTQGNVVFESGAALTVTAGSTGVGLLDVAESVTGAVSVPVTVEGEGTGKWKVVQASTALAPTFATVTPGTVLTLENGGTELWVERRAKGTVVLVR